MRISFCIEMLFSDRPFLERIPASARAGAEAIEFWSWKDKDLDAIEKAARESGLPVASFLANAPEHPLVEPAAREGFVKHMRDSIGVARRLGVKALIVTTGNAIEGRSREEMTSSCIDGLKAVAGDVEAAGVSLALEPLNTTVDHPGYFLETVEHAREIIEGVSSEAVGLLFDHYHVQIMQGNLIERFRESAPLVKHVHLADVPGRIEPGRGEINYANVLAAAGRAGYGGYSGLEYRATVSPAEESVTSAMEAIGAR